MLLKPDARTTLNIGLGSGLTLATLASYEQLESLECVEIVPQIVEAAQYIEEFAALNDPRVKIHVDDAVHFLLTTDRTYDIIIADGKQNPKFSGNAAILSSEFHRNCLAKLADDGVLIEWLSPTLPPEAFQTTLRSFCDEFPEVAAYYFIPSAIALVGSKIPIGNDPAEWPQVFANETARRDMAVFDIDNSLSLMAMRVCEGDRMRATVADAPAQHLGSPGARVHSVPPVLSHPGTHERLPEPEAAARCRSRAGGIRDHAQEQPCRDLHRFHAAAEAGSCGLPQSVGRAPGTSRTAPVADHQGGTQD